MKQSPENTQPTDNWSATRMNEIRMSIDAIDKTLVEMINERLSLAMEIGKIKKESGIKVLDKSREAKIMERLPQLNQGPLHNDVLKHIFKNIIAASRELQSPQKVSYLGPEATFTHLAATSYFGHSAHFIPQNTIRDVFTEVERGVCDYGVVPVENSIEGAVNYTLDLFYGSDLKICAEQYQHISHDLLSKTGNINDIKIVYSHPQPFAQCRRWLQKNLPDCELVETNSTADAAKRAGYDQSASAIAASAAASVYDLQIVSSGIEDFLNNVTRFLIIGHDQPAKIGHDKTSIMFVTAHVPGALFKALAPVADNGINMVKLESRPIKHEKWSYFFIMDIEGHIEDDNIKKTLDSMKQACLYLKWLGSYPNELQYES